MEARTIRCSGCGAAVPADAPQCPYCRAQLATVACPACFALSPVGAAHCPGCGAALAPRTSIVPDGAPCPACTKPLGASRVGDLQVQACLACGGLWLDRQVFEELGTSRERQGAVLGVLPAPAGTPVAAALAVQYRPCPACAKLMNRTNYAKRSGVVLDVCKEHGLWFDRDELHRVLGFIGGGGLDRARERELEDLKEARRALERPGQAPDPAFALPTQPAHPALELTAAGLLGLAAEVADAFMHRH